MGAVSTSVDLRALFELPSAVPVDIAGDTILIRCDLPGTMQLYRADPRSGAFEQLTAFSDPVEGRFVPGTEQILVEHDVAGNEHIQLSLLEARPGAELRPIVSDPRYLHRNPCLSCDGSLLAYSTNRDNGTDWSIYVRSLRDGSERLLPEPRGWCTPVGFSPDARLLAVLIESGRAGDDDLHLVDVDTGEARHVSPHEGEAAYGEPVWLPDGTAFLVATNDGRDTAAIARYELASGRWSTVIESNWDLDCVGDVAGRWLLVVENDDGYSRLRLHELGTLGHVVDVRLPARGVVEHPVFSEDGSRLAFGFSSPSRPADAWVFDVAERTLERVTELSRDLDLSVLREPELHRFDSFDGESVPVFLWEPDGDGPCPVVVMVHGGPEAQFQPSFHPSFAPFTQHLVSRGYAVATPNVRGSTGYGKRYEHLDDIRLRLDSVRDLASLLDWLGSRPRIDASRAVLYGRSYGGYMVLAGLAFQPELWAAGVECVGISSFVTFLENTAPWRRAVREPEYGSLERDREFLIEASPITHVDRIRAPLFIQHGANDPRVPLGETQQIHRVLTEKGIRCELLVHQDEGHAIGKLENRIETFERAVRFLDEVVGR